MKPETFWILLMYNMKTVVCIAVLLLLLVLMARQCLDLLHSLVSYSVLITTSSYVN